MYLKVEFAREALDRTADVLHHVAVQIRQMWFRRMNRPDKCRRAMDIILSLATLQFTIAYLEHIMIFLNSSDEPCTNVGQLLKIRNDAEVILNLVFFFSSKPYWNRGHVIIIEYLLDHLQLTELNICRLLLTSRKFAFLRSVKCIKLVFIRIHTNCRTVYPTTKNETPLHPQRTVWRRPRGETYATEVAHINAGECFSPSKVRHTVNIDSCN